MGLETIVHGARQYVIGRTFEYRVMDALKAAGWKVVRCRGSRSPIDLIAWKPGRIAALQCRKTGGLDRRLRDDMQVFTVALTQEVYCVRRGRAGLEARAVDRWDDGYKSFGGVF